ncbi:MAG: hypothetical protein MZV64_46005 [Ignavibacteriales bacterium]|nr:hypothetical protein [Ignavibacteriales bacterium]
MVIPALNAEDVLRFVLQIQLENHLSPRDIIVDIRKRTLDKAPLLVEGKTEGELFEKTLVHNYITDTALVGMYNLYGLCSGMSCND